MGIPKFFRWLTRRYPLILKNVQKEEDCPPIDNLYLDLNGIVHNCIHGNDAKRHERISKLQDFDEVWAAIMKAIDELVHTVKPQKLVFLAVDGVAPRAKMNQQRTRRFRSAKDSQMLRQQLLKEGKDAPELFDSNAISPGTKFMHELSRQLEFFVQYKLNTDPLYQKLSNGVVLSDASVPGEGEHKMMDYIRQAKNQPSYDPNTRHCFYGADADLIMLSLITHEPNFIIIREEHIVKKIKQGGVQRLDLQRTSNFQLIFINLMREYFHLEYSELAPKMKMKFDIERIIDDFVFFCFFIGNDFLPSLSALDISEGSLDSLIELYKTLLPQMTNYITEAGKIYWDRAEPFIKMLGDHEHESFKNRLHSIEHARKERIISFDPDFGKTNSRMDRATLIKNKIREKMIQKKTEKILHLKNKNTDKRYKKFQLLKRFEEDDIAVEKSLTAEQRKIRDAMREKYLKIRELQGQQHSHAQSETEESKTSDQIETLRDIIHGIKEEYFSDLNVEDIGDDQVSDIDESEIDITGIPELDSNIELENKIKVQNDIIDKYSEQNLEFITEFIKMYSRDAGLAKAYYYQKKVKFDVNTPQGQSSKKKMLKKYIEGLQWVLYYYYKGAQHWRWYYPYHYAPMISDIDENIVANYLQGYITIEQFEIDANCSDINKPYTPFQQLLSILPLKSLKLLPEQYADIARGELLDCFPEDFDIDLNGRALPWEAACLIPFCDEYRFISQETQLLAQQPIAEEDQHRNIIYFHYKKFTYDKNQKPQEGTQGPRKLFSSLTKLSSLDANYTKMQLLDEYKDVGKYTFLPQIDPRVVQPCPDFPSFSYLNVIKVEYDEKIINQVPFKRVLVKVPQCPEDTSYETLEKTIQEFIKQGKKELYMGFPYQFECFPTLYEDDKYTYTLYGDAYTNIYKLHQDNQQLEKDKYDSFAKRQFFKQLDMGILLEKPRAFISVNRVTEVRYDSSHNVYYKVYSEESEIVPLSLIMKKRSPSHYLDQNLRCSNIFQSLHKGQEVVCLNTQLFGVIGQVDHIAQKKNLIKVKFDIAKEEAKIHDPFFGQLILMSQQFTRQDNVRRYYTDQLIEQELKLKRGVINKLTSSFLVTFNDKKKLERQVIDLGLNIKNFTKKVHIPDYVRFVADEDLLADNQYDTYNHNMHARGTKHVRKHWEYSQECFDIIKEYCTKYYDIIDCVYKTLRANKQVHTVKELFPKQDEQLGIQRVRDAAAWIEGLPISNLPYVEMGFDALHEDLIIKLNNQRSMIQSHYQTVNLNCKETEYLQPKFLYQESFPFWSQPYSTKSVSDFKVGDRVMNINSVKREYVPFGLRGTVVGKTNDKVIILFDQQFLNGNNIYGHCEDYKGGFIEPNHLINLTQKFSSLMKRDLHLVEGFQEQPYTVGDQQQEMDYQSTQEQVRHEHNHHHHQKVDSHKLDSKVKVFREKPRQKEESKIAAVEQIDTYVKGHRQVYINQEILQQEESKVIEATFIQQEQYAQQEASAIFLQDPSVMIPQQITATSSEPQPSETSQGGFVMNFDNILQNPDFQQLMNMMNFAQQMQQNNPLAFDINSINLNTNAEVFVPNKPATEINLNTEAEVFVPKKSTQEEDKKSDQQ